MNRIALKMLMGERLKYFGLIAGTARMDDGRITQITGGARDVRRHTLPEARA